MSRQRNQNDGNLRDILRRLYRLERQSLLANSSIGREGLEVYDGGWIRILNGGLQVIGTATISGSLDVTGTLNASGDINLSGTTEITGPLDVSGATTISGQLDVTGPTNLDGELTINGNTTITGLLAIDGDTTISGTLDIDGVATLNSDLNVVNNGKIKVGSNMTLTPQTGGGAVEFANGNSISSLGQAMELNAGTTGVAVSPSGFEFDTGGGALLNLMADNTWSIAGGGGSIMANGAGILSMGYTRLNLSGTLEVGNNLVVNGDVVRMPNLVTVTAAPNVYITSNGTLRKTTWTP